MSILAQTPTSPAPRPKKSSISTITCPDSDSRVPHDVHVHHNKICTGYGSPSLPR